MAADMFHSILLPRPQRRYKIPITAVAVTRENQEFFCKKLFLVAVIIL